MTAFVPTDGGSLLNASGRRAVAVRHARCALPAPSQQNIARVDRSTQLRFVECPMGHLMSSDVRDANAECA
jgi:hypothetical protein